MESIWNIPCGFHDHSIPFHVYSIVKVTILSYFIHHSIWNPWNGGGIHPFHMESIWNIAGSVKYCIMVFNVIGAILKLIVMLTCFIKDLKPL